MMLATGDWGGDADSVGVKVQTSYKYSTLYVVLAVSAHAEIDPDSPIIILDDSLDKRL